MDEETLHTVFKKFSKIITVEDGTVVGGFGSSILEFMCDNSYSSEIRRLGIPDRFIEHGTQQELYKECGFDAESIISAIRSMVKQDVFFKVG